MGQHFVHVKPGEFIDRSNRRHNRKVPEWRSDDFRALVNCNADGMVVLDHSGYVLYVNPAAEALFNMTSAEMVGAMFGFPILVDQPVELYILKGFRDFVSAEMRLVEVVWAGESAYLLTFRDLTERVIAEQAVSQARDELEVKVKVRTGELTAANERLKLEIAERKQAEEALQESEAKYRAFILASSDAVYRMSPDWTEMRYLHGRQFLPDTDNPSSTWLDKYIHPDDQPCVLEAINEAIQTKSVFELEHRVIRVDGSLGWTFSRAVPMLDETGEIVEWLGTAVDITEQKRAKESEERLIALMDHNPSLVFLKDEAGRYIYLNSSYERQFIHSSNWYGKTDFDFWPRESAELFRADDVEVLRSGQTKQFLEDSTDLQGKRYCWLCYKFPFVDSSGNRYIGGIGIDTTGRVEAQEALMESQALLRLLTEEIPDPIFVKDRECRLLMANPATLQVIGKPLEEVIGRTDREFYDDPAVGEAIAANDRRIMESGKTEVVEEVAQTPGGYRTFISTKTPFRNTRGEIVGIMGVSRDITERKQAEKALRETKEQAELYIDLMSHDINNMNQSALGFLELALDTLEIDGKIGPDGKLLIEKPLQAIRSSSKLIENVRILQQLTTEGIKARPIDLHSLFDDLKAQDFHVEGKEVSIRFEPIPHYIVEGSELLRDVFYNLISNAVKHSLPDKPVAIEVKVEPAAEGGYHYYKCIVEDNGPGIPDEVKSKLFHRFQRGKTKAHGKGLGLYLVRTLIENYHGRVWVEDRVPGDHTKGARFVVMLPAVTE